MIRRSGKLLIETINNGRDTIALTDYTAQAYFSRATSGKVDSLRLEWDKKPRPRLAEGVYLPNELVRMNHLKEAMAGYWAMNLNVFQLTYMAYDFTSNRPANLTAAEGL